MSTVTKVPRNSPSRHPFGLPPGSVRSVLALQIVGLFWLLLILPEERRVPVPLYLHVLSGMVLVYFATHGAPRNEAPDIGRHPLGLPRGSIPIVLIVGSIVIVAWKYNEDSQALLTQLTPIEGQLKYWPYLAGSLVGGFLIGKLANLSRLSAWPPFQDFQAWVSLLAMLGLGAEVFLQAFINPRLRESYDAAFWNSLLTALVALYFGSRS